MCACLSVFPLVQATFEALDARLRALILVLEPLDLATHRMQLFQLVSEFFLLRSESVGLLLGVR